VIGLQDKRYAAIQEQDLAKVVGPHKPGLIFVVEQHMSVQHVSTHQHTTFFHLFLVIVVLSKTKKVEIGVFTVQTDVLYPAPGCGRVVVNLGAEMIHHVPTATIGLVVNLVSVKGLFEANHAEVYWLLVHDKHCGAVRVREVEPKLSAVFIGTSF
jgi:hypothetical protein